MATNRGKHEGSIFKTPGGKWRAQYSAPNGHRFSETFVTKEEAKQWLIEQRSNQNHGFDFKGSMVTLREYLEKWLETSCTSLREKTTLNYKRMVLRYIVPHRGKMSLKDLDLATIEWFYSQLGKEGIGPRTVRVCHNILHKSLDKAVRYRLVTYNPSHGASLPRYSHGEMMILDEYQVTQFLVAAQESPYRALYYVAVTTGMRIGEIFGLKWTDLRWGSGELHVQRQVQRIDGKGNIFVEPKTKAGRRTIRLGENTLQILREHREKQEAWKVEIKGLWKENGLIFPSSRGTPGDSSNLRKDYNETLARAGVPKIRFHDLRHTAASLLLNNNVSPIVVSNMLGHSKPSITLDIYGHLISSMQSQAANVMDQLVTPIRIEVKNKELVEKVPKC